MHPAVVTVLSITTLFLAYRFYGKFLSKRLFDIDPSRPTPAQKLEDGVDYVPTNKFVLFGHHFASIAGAAPIVGPAIAVIWGWLPALLWIVFGTIFIGGVHDFGALVVSLHNKGRSIGDVSKDLIGTRATIIFQLIIFFLLALAMGVFVILVVKLFKGYPEVIIPSMGLIGIATLIGALMRKKIISLIPATIIGLALFAGAIAAGVYAPSSQIDPFYWKITLLVYALVASVLPVWLLLQPRDYINSFQLYAGLAVLYIGFFVGANNFEFAAPAIRNVESISDVPLMIPFLFITIACGAISGFHSLVSSGTTSKQLATEKDARFITYGGMLTESIMAIMAVMATTVILSGTAASNWESCYSCFRDVKLNSIGTFVDGGANFLLMLGIPAKIGKTLIGVTLVGFCLTTLDTATRPLRYNVAEIGGTIKIKPLANKYIASIVAIGAIGFFAFLKIQVGVGEDGAPVYKEAGFALWQLFGTTNQILGAIALMTISIYLYIRGKPVIYTLLPMIFLLVMTIWAMILKFMSFISASYINWPLTIISALTMIMAVWLLIEGAFAIKRHKRKQTEEVNPNS